MENRTAQENKGMTVRQVVDQIVKDLGAIEVRMSDIERYGIPIGRAIAGLNEICKAWDMQEAQEKAEQEKAAQEDQDGQEEPEFKIDLVPMDEVPEEELKG